MMKIKDVMWDWFSLGAVFGLMVVEVPGLAVTLMLSVLIAAAMIAMTLALGDATGGDTKDGNARGSRL